MSWADELYRVYEQNCGKESDGEQLLPIYHSTANAQIEVTLNEQGEMVNATTIDKVDAVTIIPVTEDSGSRSSGIAPMPFADKLIYIAGDYYSFVEGKNSDNTKYFDKYMENLKAWNDSEYTHPAVQAVYSYLEKRVLIKDLIERGVLQVDSETGKICDKIKIAGISQPDSFVRFRIHYDDLLQENRTWKDKTLYDSFIAFNNSSVKNKQLCYATGELLPVTYKHPSKIRNAGDKAKLISSNDESGFTYRGRFDNKEQAISVSYEFSQKMHNALKWLIAKQGMYFDSLALVVWASALTPLPNIKQSFDECYGDEFPEDDLPDTQEGFKMNLNKMIFGYKNRLEQNSKAMILGLDAATTGRLSVSMYSELEGSVFLDNIQKWHEDLSVYRFNSKQLKSCVNSFSVYEIANCAFGLEQNDKLTCKPEVLKETILRLVPCITEGKSLPADIIRSIYYKASNPLAYGKDYNHRVVLETACGLIKKYNIENKKGVSVMAYDPNEKNRSYLYGCLLAIADKAESDTYNAEDKGKRITNARRYWNAFSSRPYQTWEIIENKLRPYIDKSEGGWYDKLFNEVMDKFELSEFADNSALEPSYLLGYHHFTAYMYQPKNKEEEK